MTLQYITLQHITLHYIAIHYITIHCITLHYNTLRYITIHYITLHYITLRYITYIHLYIYNKPQCRILIKPIRPPGPGTAMELPSMVPLTVTIPWRVATRFWQPPRCKPQGIKLVKVRNRLVNPTDNPITLEDRSW